MNNQESLKNYTYLNKKEHHIDNFHYINQYNKNNNRIKEESYENYKLVYYHNIITMKMII